jgi:hypothetical protein
MRYPRQIALQTGRSVPARAAAIGSTVLAIFTTWDRSQAANLNDYVVWYQERPR